MFVMADLKIYNIKQDKVKVKVVRYGCCQETSGFIFLRICKSSIDKAPLLQ